MSRNTWPLALVFLAVPPTASLAQEQPLICFGNEPSWRLDLTETGKARFSTPDSPVVEYLGAANATAGRQESVWRGQASTSDGGELAASLQQAMCSDGMSDARHPYAARVSLANGRHYTGCCRVPEAPDVAATVEQATWRLAELPGKTLPAARARNAVTVRFQAGRTHGFSGCNQFAGSYTLEGETLVLGTLGGTMMTCPEPALSVEAAFLRSFSGALGVAGDGDVLTLTPVGGGAPLRFEREVPLPLEGRPWEVTGYNNGRQAVVSPMTGTRLTLTFQDGGLVSGSGGCNRFHGSFTAEENRLTIHPLATTRKACDEAAMVQERAFLTALESATTWEIARGMLDVHRADGERVLTASSMGE